MVVEQTRADRNGNTRVALEISVFNASQRDVGLVQSMHSLSFTGTNFVRIGVANYDPDDPVDELAMAMVLMGESPRDYEGMVLRDVTVRYESVEPGKERANVRIMAEQWFIPTRK